MDGKILFSNLIVVFQLQKEMREGVCVSLYVSACPGVQASAVRVRSARMSECWGSLWVRVGMQACARVCTQVSEPSTRHCKDTTGCCPPASSCSWVAPRSAVPSTADPPTAHRTASLSPRCLELPPAQVLQLCLGSVAPFHLTPTALLPALPWLPLALRTKAKVSLHSQDSSSSAFS